MDRDEPVSPVVSLASGELAAMSKNERHQAREPRPLLRGRTKAERPRLPRPSSTRSAQGEPTMLSARGQGALEVLRDLQAAGARRARQEDPRLLLHGAHQAPGRRRALAARSGLALDEAADRFADGTLRITSRQGIQYHHVYGPKLAPLMRHLNRHYRGRGHARRLRRREPQRDDARRSTASTRASDRARDASSPCAIAEELAPRARAPTSRRSSPTKRAKPSRRMNADEPLYGAQYLPRKFKIGIAHPTDNSVDVLTQDVGLRAGRDGGRATAASGTSTRGGGLGLTHNNPTHGARCSGLYLGRIRARAGRRRGRARSRSSRRSTASGSDRRQARWKYTIRRLGVAAVKRGAARAASASSSRTPRPLPLPPMRLHLGWHAQRGRAELVRASPSRTGASRAARAGRCASAVETPRPAP